jgi:hypothetical protein
MVLGFRASSRWSAAVVWTGLVGLVAAPSTGCGPGVLRPGAGDASCGATPNGASETRLCYAAAAVPAGQTCASTTQIRTCVDGVWRPDYPSCDILSCTVAGQASCGATPSGQTESRPCYPTSSVAAGQTCQATTQTRTCVNGSWSPDYPACASLTCSVASGTRDPRQWPFAETSIWNLPIGSGATYAAANLDVDAMRIPTYDELVAAGKYVSGMQTREWTDMPFIDEEVIILHPEASTLPLRHSTVGWSAGDRCVASDSTVLYPAVPWPATYFVPNGGGNASTAVLLPDGRSLLQFQPAARCSGYDYITALTILPAGTVDLYGDGTLGSHGGSGLSAIGGSLRVGELTHASGAPRHALKCAVPTTDLHYCRDDGRCNRWPVPNAGCYWDTATQSCKSTPGPGDGQWGYGLDDDVPSQNGELQMGALLALDPSVDLAALGLETEPGQMVAWTLQNYGMYVNDDTGGGATSLVIDAEIGPDGRFEDTFKSAWGFAFKGYVKDRATNPFLRDLQKVLKLLKVVTNNGPSSIGGGGTPRQPLAPPFS